MNLRVTLPALLTVFACASASASQADERAIRQAYKLRDLCFRSRDAKKLATTELPGFYALQIDGDAISNAQIKEHLAWRFGSQVKATRYEKPLSFKFSKDRAEVRVLISDDFVVADKAKVQTRSIRREHGIGTWQKTAKGWKLEKLQFTKVEWVDANGKWQVAKAKVGS